MSGSSSTRAPRHAWIREAEVDAAAQQAADLMRVAAFQKMIARMRYRALLMANGNPWLVNSHALLSESDPQE